VTPHVAEHGLGSARLLEHRLGLTWVAQDALERASHALVDDGRVWLVDPVDEPAAIERARALGTAAGVLQLLDRHVRDCAALAERLDVPLHVVPDAVPGSPFSAIRVLRMPGWRESALWWPARRALVVAEVVGTSPHVTLGGSRAAGIHPLLRLRPPAALRPYQPEHLLVGHGEPVHGPEAADALHTAYARSRRDLPRMVLEAPALLGAARGRWG